MDRLNKEELRWKLTKLGMPDDVAKAIQDEDIDGQVFINLTEDDFRQDFSFKVGQRKRLMAIIEANKSAKSAINITSSASNPKIVQQMVKESTAIKEEIMEPFTPIVSSTRRSDSMIVQHDLDMENESIDIKEEILEPVTPIVSSSRRADSKNIDVLQAITAHPEGSAIIRSISEHRLLVGAKRSAMIRILVAKLVNTVGHYYPSHEEKEALAKNIVSAFPCLQSDTTRGRKGHEQFYDGDSRSGFIEYRLKTVRTRLSPSQKKHRIKSKNPSYLQEAEEVDVGVEEDEDDKEAVQVKIAWMKFEKSAELSREVIRQNLAHTFKYRRNQIKKKSLSITDILQDYPRLGDFDGDMIHHEFALMNIPKNDESVNFKDRLVRYYAPRILQYTRTFKPDLAYYTARFKDENVRAIVQLAALLPVNNATKRPAKKAKTTPDSTSQRRDLPPSSLLQFVRVGDDIETIANRKQDEVHPFLVCSGTPEDGGTFHLILDRFVLQVGDCPLNAIDILFKSFFVFDVRFNIKLRRFYLFLQTRMYSISSEANWATIESLDTSLRNISI